MQAKLFHLVFSQNTAIGSNMAGAGGGQGEKRQEVLVLQMV